MTLIAKSLQQSRLRLVVDEVSLVSTCVRDDQIILGHDILRQMDHHSRLLAKIIDCQSRLQSLKNTGQSPLDARGPSHEIESASTTASRSTVSIRTHLVGREAHCSPSCPCACHTKSRFCSPKVLGQLLGAFFLGYSRGPTAQRCTARRCKAHVSFQLNIKYLFPSWLLHNVMLSIVASRLSNEISVGFTARAMIAPCARIFYLIQQNDVTGLQGLLSSRLANPNDMELEHGNTPLFVSLKCSLSRKLPFPSFEAESLLSLLFTSDSHQSGFPRFLHHPDVSYQLSSIGL